MSSELWAGVDDYIERTVAVDAAAFEPIRAAQAEGGDEGPVEHTAETLFKR